MSKDCLSSSTWASFVSLSFLLFFSFFFFFILGSRMCRLTFECSLKPEFQLLVFGEAAYSESGEVITGLKELLASKVEESLRGLGRLRPFEVGCLIPVNEISFATLRSKSAPDLLSVGHLYGLEKCGEMVQATLSTARFAKINNSNVEKNLSRPRSCLSNDIDKVLNSSPMVSVGAILSKQGSLSDFSETHMTRIMDRPSHKKRMANAVVIDDTTILQLQFYSFPEKVQAFEKARLSKLTLENHTPDRSVATVTEQFRGATMSESCPSPLGSKRTLVDEEEVTPRNWYQKLSMLKNEFEKNCRPHLESACIAQ